VAEHDLEIPNKGSILQGVSGEGVTEMMGRDAVQSAVESGLFDGPLDVGLVAAPAHDFPGAGMTAGGASGKQPSPTLGERC